MSTSRWWGREVSLTLIFLLLVFGKYLIFYYKRKISPTEMSLVRNDVPNYVRGDPRTTFGGENYLFIITHTIAV